MEDLIDSLEVKLEEVKQEFANKNCPFNVGDVGIIRSYSHTGKVGIVTKISYRKGYPAKHGYEAFIDVYKKNGEKSQFTTSVWREDQFELEVK